MSLKFIKLRLYPNPQGPMNDGYNWMDWMCCDNCHNSTRKGQQYWFIHTYHILYIKFVFYRGVSSFTTDCPCGIWRRGLNICFLYVGLLFKNLVFNNSWPVSLKQWNKMLLIVLLPFLRIYDYANLDNFVVFQSMHYFYLPYFQVSNNDMPSLPLPSLFSTDVVLTLSLREERALHTLKNMNWHRVWKLPTILRNVLIMI